MHVVDFGSNTHYVPAPLELFIDGKAATLARWPNRNDATPMLGLIESAVQDIVKDEKGGAKEYATIILKDVPTKPWGTEGNGDYPALFPQQAISHLSQWGTLEDAYVVGGLVRAYAHTSRKIGAVDAKQGTVTFTTPIQVWPTYKDMAKWFYFSNLPEELDVPGEYYLDRRTGVLTLYPPAGFNDKSEVLVSMLNDVLVAMEGCSHVRLRGLTVEVTRTSGIYIERGEDNIVEHCVIRNTGIAGVQIGFGWDTGLPGEWAAQVSRGIVAPPKSLPLALANRCRASWLVSACALHRDGATAESPAGRDGVGSSGRAGQWSRKLHNLRHRNRWSAPWWWRSQDAETGGKFCAQLRYLPHRSPRAHVCRSGGRGRVR